VVRDGEDGPEIVGWVAPCKGQWCHVSCRALGSFGWRDGGDTSHSAARKQSLKSSQRMMVPMLNAPRIGSSW
jgi:hypothetical protein